MPITGSLACMMVRCVTSPALPAARPSPESVKSVFIDIVHFTENADTLYRAAALGPVTPLSAAEMDSFLERFDRPRHVDKLWRYYVGRSLRDGAMPEAWAEALGDAG